MLDIFCLGASFLELWLLGQILGFWKPKFLQKVEFENGLVDFL